MDPAHAAANYAYDARLVETPWGGGKAATAAAAAAAGPAGPAADGPADGSLRRTRDCGTATETSVGDAALRRALSVVAALARERNLWANARARDALLMGASEAVEPRARAIALDGLFAPTLSAHEKGVPLAGFRCANSSFATGFCHRTLSHLLGITRAMRLKTQLERERGGAPYDAVFLSRWDVLWRSPLLAELPRLRGWRLGSPWLPFCTC